MSSEDPKRQRPRILKGPSVSTDVFVLPVHEAALPAFDGAPELALPFTPPRLDPIELPETGLADAAFPDAEPEAARAGFGEAEERAADMLQQARLEVAAMLETARQQVTSWQQEAYAEGYKVAVTMAQQELSGRLRQAASLLDEAQGAKAMALADVEPEVVKLVLAIAKKIIQREIQGDPRIVVEAVRAALQRLGGRAVARVRVNPAEVSALNEVWHDLSTVAREIEFLPDARVMPGGCIVESRQGEIDAQIETQIEAVTAQFLEAVGETESTLSPAGPT